MCSFRSFFVPGGAQDVSFLFVRLFLSARTRAPSCGLRGHRHSRVHSRVCSAECAGPVAHLLLQGVEDEADRHGRVRECPVRYASSLALGPRRAFDRCSGVAHTFWRSPLSTASSIGGLCGRTGRWKT